jgi:hypothetical protein
MHDIAWVVVKLYQLKMELIPQSSMLVDFSLSLALVRFRQYLLIDLRFHRASWQNWKINSTDGIIIHFTLVHSTETFMSQKNLKLLKAFSLSIDSCMES